MKVLPKPMTLKELINLLRSTLEERKKKPIKAFPIENEEEITIEKTESLTFTITKKDS